MIYLDTSVAVPMFIQESASDAVDAWYETCAEPIVASDWILTEFASAVSIKLRRGEIDARQASTAGREFDAFCRSGLRLLTVSRKAFADAAGLARDVKSGLRSGDSLHLAMALEAGAGGFATADATLAKNAAAQGLNVTQF